MSTSLSTRVRGRHLAEPSAVASGDAWIVGAAVLAILMLWWASYFPGLMTVDSFQAWKQIEAGVYQDWHPVFHTWVMGLLLSIAETPGILSLAQVVGLAAVLANLTRQLETIGVPRRVRIALPIVMAAIPPVGKLVVTIWKDVPFAISVLWVFVEVVGVVGTRIGGWSWGRTARLGLALLNVYVWRHNGLLVASLVLAACWLAFRSDWRRMAVVTLIAVGGLMAVKGPLYSALDAWPTPALQSHATLIHDMGAFLTHHESSFSPAELSFLETILPFERWTAGAEGRYDCRQATGLIFAPDLYPVTRYDPTGQLVSIRDIDPVLYQNPDSNELTANLDRFRSIWWKAVRQHPLTFLGHRLCVSASAWSPVSLFGESPLVPGRTMADNDLGLRTTPLTPGLKSVLDWYVGVWNSLRVVAWRPAWILYPGFVAAALGWRRLRDRFPDAWLVQVTGLAAWMSVVLVTPGQSFRYVWPAYLCAWAAFAFFARSRT